MVHACGTRMWYVRVFYFTPQIQGLLKEEPQVPHVPKLPHLL